MQLSSLPTDLRRDKAPDMRASLTERPSRPLAALNHAGWYKAHSPHRRFIEGDGDSQYLANENFLLTAAAPN